MDKLLPCPFCGGEAAIFQGSDENQHTVRCVQCAIKMPIMLNREGAIEAWNRRAKPENEPLTRCENCTHWDKSISFMMSAHACSYWSPSKRSPRYTEGFEFCSFASAKPERSEG